jgi:hypothetical protein
MTKTFYALRNKRMGKWWDISTPPGRWVTDLHAATWLDNGEFWRPDKGSEVVAIDVTGRVRR